MKTFPAAVYLLYSLLTLFSPALAAAPEMLPLTRDGKERVCLDCHRAPNLNSNEGIAASRGQCLDCHARPTVQRRVGEQTVSLQVTLDAFKKNRHTWVACVQCHQDVGRSPHKTLNRAQCLNCHPPHGEGEVGDPHLRVSCQACHHPSKFVRRDPARDQVILSSFDQKGRPLALTDHRLADTEKKDLCLKCHFPQNQVGAAAAVLPSKSLICLVCHNAPLSVGHPMFWVAFLLLLFGFLITVLFWFQGSVQGEERSLHRKLALGSETVWQTLFSRRFWGICGTLFFDIFLQRRILQESVKRWLIHSLIFLPILGRFFLSLFTVITYRISPGGSLALALIDKNNGFVAFTNDFLGLLVLLGLLLALTQRLVVRPPQVLSEGQDHWALAIIGTLILLGFLLEGVRILMTQVPAEKAVYAFIGYPLSRLLAGQAWDWARVYVALWYAHAAAGAFFIAYLPFGKMRHVLVTPLSLILGAKPSGPKGHDEE